MIPRDPTSNYDKSHKRKFVTSNGGKDKEPRIYNGIDRSQTSILLF